MAITSTQQEVLKIVVGLFNAVPGKSNFDGLSALLDGGMTSLQVAEALDDIPLFVNDIIGNAATVPAKVAILMNNFGLSTAGDLNPNSAASQANAFFTARIEGGATFGAIVHEAIQFLSTGSVPAEFADTAALLNNKAAVAEYYSVTKGLSASTLEGLQQIISKVTATTDVSTPAALDNVIAQATDSVAPEATAATFDYVENATDATVLGTVAATDNVGVTGFEIVSGNDSSFFAIDASGKITLTAAGVASAANDFEADPNSVTLGVVALDAAGNQSAAVDVILNETNVDDAAPALTAQVLSGNKAVLTFDEAFDSSSVPSGSSFTVVEDASTNVAVNSISVSGQIVTLTLATTPTGTVKVSYTPPGVAPLQDAAGNDVAAFSDKTLTVDVTAPTLSSSTPADNGTGFAIDSNLVLTFSETVQAGTGNIVITNAADATDTRTIAITDTTQVTFNGSTVTINPAADLQEGANYNVQIAATAIKDSVGNAYAGITDSTSLNFGTVGSTAVPLALTVNTDTITGTSANESIDGSSFISTTGARVQTLNNADRIDGGAGTDSLTLQLSAAVAVTPASLVGIETLNVEFIAADILNLINGDANIQTINSSNNAAVSTINNIQSKVATYNLSNITAAANTFTTTTTNTLLAGASDALAINLSNVAGVGGAVVPLSIGTVTAANGYETMTIASNGAIANSVSLTDGVATGLKTINVSGAQALTLTLLDTTVTTVNASSATGNQTLTVAAANGQNMTITGGSGNDIIGMSGTYTTSDIITGGVGTDRLTLTNAEAIGATTAQSNVTGIEVIGLSDGSAGTITLGNFGATGLRFGANTAGATSVNYAAGTGNTLDLQTFTGAGGAVTATVAGTATTDVLGVTIGSTAAGNIFGAALTANGAEAINLLSQGGANSFTALTMTDTAANQSLVITGDQNFTVIGAVRADSINASGMTGSATLTLTGGTGTTATTITGTGNADALNGSTAGDIINGGAGADTIANVITGTAATAGDVLTGGTGFDTFILRGDTASAAVATAYAAAANVTDYALGSSTTTTDILQLSGTIANYSGGSAFFAGVAAAAAGSTAIQSVGQNAAAAAVIAGVDLVKLTTGVATTGLTVQTAFNAAIGTATVTGLVAGDDIFVSFYDTTNSKMVVGLVDAGAGNTVVGTGDTVTLVGTIDMSAADYASLNANNLSIIGA